MSLIGRKAAPLAVLGTRELEREELESLAEERGVQKAEPIKKLAARHHALARMLASGMTPGEAAICVGYTPSRVSILQGDPMFQELVNMYTDGVQREFLGMAGKMASLGEDFVDEWADRLEQEPEKFSNTEIAEAVKALADRTGHGVSTKQDVNVKVGLGERFQAAAARVAAERASRIIDVTPENE